MIAGPKKEEMKAKIMDYLSNPDNEWLSRVQLATSVCEYAGTSGLYKVLSSDELTQIEQDALTARMKRMGGKVCNVVNKLYELAIKGDTAAAKEYLKRTMGDKSINEIDLKLPDGIRVEIIKPRPELQEK